MGAIGGITQYDRVLGQFGSELGVLLDVPLDELRNFSTLLGEAISRLRKGQVIKKSGYDGEYGVIRLFEQGEIVGKYNSL